MFRGKKQFSKKLKPGGFGRGDTSGGHFTGNNERPCNFFYAIFRQYVFTTRPVKMPGFRLLPSTVIGNSNSNK